MASSFLKVPSDVMDYAFDWSTWLGTDTISSDDVTVETGITKDSDTSTTTKVTVWLSGGTDDTDYKVTSKVVTAEGRTKSKYMVIKVRAI